MEPAGMISDSNWSSFAFEDSEFMSQLFCNYPSNSNLQEIDSNADHGGWYYNSAGHEDLASISNVIMSSKGEEAIFNANGSMYNSITSNWPHHAVPNTSVGASEYVNGDTSGFSNFNHVYTREEPHGGPLDLLIMLNEEDHKLTKGDMVDESKLNSSEMQVVPITNYTSPKRKLMQASEPDDQRRPKLVDDHTANNQFAEINPKKKTRGSRAHVQRNTRAGVQTRKNMKLPAAISTNDEEDSNMVTSPNGQSSSSYSEDESNGSEETHGGASSSSKGSKALNLSGKTRASRGSATDPQSLYARKRRERINERLRILQNLVPNGTKVDISTMLEEAVQYVKFLQLQIKLLSSDDLWMYAPIAYNGMDIGLDLKISPPQ